MDVAVFPCGALTYDAATNIACQCCVATSLLLVGTSEQPLTNRHSEPALASGTPPAGAAGAVRAPSSQTQVSPGSCRAFRKPSGCVGRVGSLPCSCGRAVVRAKDTSVSPHCPPARAHLGPGAAPGTAPSQWAWGAGSVPLPGHLGKVTAECRPGTGPAAALQAALLDAK